MFEWLGGVVTTVVETVQDVFSGGGSPPPDVPPSCEEGDCAAAVVAARVARADQQNVCLHAKVQVMILEGMIRLATPTRAQLALYVILFLIAFGPAGIFIGAIGYMLLLLFIRAWSPVTAQALELLAVAEANLQTAIRDVGDRCPTDCIAALSDDIVDLTPCDVVDPADLLGNVPLNDMLGIGRSFRGQ